MNLKLSPEIAAGFVEEAQGYFAQMREAFLQWAAGDAGALEEPRRLIHTIKGAASMIGLPALAHVSLLFEDTLKLFAGHIPAPGQPLQFQSALQSLESYVAGIARGDRRNSELAATIVSLRRSRGDGEEGDSGAVKQILGHEPVSTPVQTGNAEEETDLRANFRYEAEDQLLAIGRSLRMLETQRDQGDNKEILRALRRSIHSLKGASQSVGLKALTELTHRLEDLLDGITSDQISFSRGVERLLFSTFDTITDLATGDQEEASVWDRVNALRDMFTAVITSSRSGVEFGVELADPEETEPVGEDDEAEEIPAEFIDVFRQEADEHLNTIASRLREIETAAATEERRSAIQDLRRATHTLKGAAGVIGFQTLSTLAHRMEDLLDDAWESNQQLEPAQLQLLHETSDVLADLATEPAKRTEALGRRRDLLQRYATWKSQASAPLPTFFTPPKVSEPVSEPAAPVIEIPQGEDPTPKPIKNLARLDPAADRTAQYVRVPIERLDEMVRLVSELVVSRSTFEQYLEAYRHDVDELRFSLGRLRRLSQKFDTDFEVQALLGGPGGLVNRTIGADRQGVTDKRSEFDSLEFDRYTDLHLVARDLGETVTDISVGVSLLSHRSGDFDSYLTRVGRLTSDIQDRFMRMRMVPLANLATRLHRVVRVTADKVGKQVDLVLEGEQVEMDKTALEELAGPLEHLLRNAVDHGIENEHLRRNGDKRPRGQVTIRAYYLGTHIVVEVTDDGRGMDATAIRRRAVAQGLYTESEAAALSDAEAFELCFRPGFSTAREVSDISGRGVGLDVVKGAVTKMKGAITIESRPGEGTTFHLRLPMSLAILRVLMVKARGEVYAVPLGAVTRILRLEPGQLEKVGHQQVLRLEKQVLPALRLGEALGGKATAASVEGTDQERPPVLVVDLGATQAALIVDELLLAREVVVKTLGSLIRKIRGVTGTTIRGDGSIVLIVNPPELFDNGRAIGVNNGTSRASRTPRQTGFDVLVVDDSVSVRRVLTNLFQNHGWRPTSAKDGMEALEILQSGKRFDAVLLDMEMPRMDGYELLTILRGQAQFAELPVVMLTSRAADKHRRKAFELGASDYLVKPYQDDALLGVIQRVVQARQDARNEVHSES
jgi:chemosensory pili system protein ChpA (sensor histidine kinase/response regulator)